MIVLKICAIIVTGMLYWTPVSSEEVYLNFLDSNPNLYFSDGADDLPVCYNGWDNDLNSGICSALDYGTYDTDAETSYTNSELAASGYYTYSSADESYTKVLSGASCVEFVQIVCLFDVCGKADGGSSSTASTRIIGGSEADICSWPFQIALNANGNHSCGGTLIDDEYVLTAAHCVEDDLDAATYTVTVGRNDLSDGSEQFTHTESVSVVIIHPDYDTDTIQNDIALLKLSSPVTFNKCVRKACMPRESETVPTSARCYASGWGLVDVAENEYPNILMEVQQTLITDTECANDDFISNTSFDADQMICAGNSREGTCSGDSGGPLVCLDDNSQWVIVGVTSYGNEDCTSISVYADVKHYVDWIFDNTDEEVAFVANDRFNSGKQLGATLCYCVLATLLAFLCF